MYIDFSSIFHRSSKDLLDKGRVNIPADSTLWPPEWSTVYYKSYPRVPKIILNRERPEAEFAAVLENRHSTREFSSRPVDVSVMSKLLLYSCGILSPGRAPDSPMRSYASGGARFPIEVYPVVFSGSDEIPSGVYHYDVKAHALDMLWKRTFSPQDISGLFSYPWIQNASMVLIMTAEFWRSQTKYGERGYRYILLEAGHMSENVYLTAEAIQLGCCAMGGFQDVKLEKLLDIDGVTESVVHTLILG